MRIAMFTDAFYPFPSGVSTAIVALANMLAEAGHFVFIQAPKPKHDVDLSFLHPNITVKYVRAMDVIIYPDFRLGTNLPLFLRDLKEFNPDVIHVHTPLSVGLEGTLIGRRLKLPMVQTFHTYYMDEDNFKIFGIQDDSVAKFIAKGGWKFNSAVTRLFDATFAPTHSVKKDLTERRTPGEIIVTPNILSDDHCEHHTRPVQKARKLLYVGRQSPEKRIDLLLRVFQQVNAAVPSTELHLIGDGPARHDLFDQTIKLGIAPQVRWYGKIPHETLIAERYYHKGDLFICASRYETFGYTTLEALAHELPVVTVNCRANSEIVGNAGWVVPDSEDESELVHRLALATIKACDMDLALYRKRAYKQALQYTPSHLVGTYEAAYKKAVKIHSQKT